MNQSLGRPFRLVTRGGPGLSCDRAGVVLGGVDLVRTSGGEGLTGSEVRPIEELGEILRLAYGAQSADVVRRCHAGLKRAAARLEACDLASAALEAVMIGFPDLPSTAMTRLSVFADLEKGGTAWQNELRIPAGQPGGGQWTTGGASDATAAGGGNAAHTTPPIEGGERNPLLDNGIYRPLEDQPARVLTGGPVEAEEGFRQGSAATSRPTNSASFRSCSRA